MSQPKCSCAAFDRLEGASVPAYINVFLDDLGRAEPAEKNHFRCRVCGRKWEKQAPCADTKGTRPALIRLDKS